MKRIATLGAIITAFAVAPSVAVAADKPAVEKPQLTAQVVRVQTAEVQRARAAALSVQRHRVAISRGQGFSVLLRMQVR